MMAAVSVLSFNMIAPSLAAIAEAYDTTYARASFAVSGFLAVNAVLFLVLGPLSDRYGRRPVLLWCVGIYVVASIGAALAGDIWTFLVFRTFQAAVIAGSVISNAAVRDTSDPSEAASRLGYLSMAMAVAPMVGPIVGGVLDQFFGWRAIFWVYTALGVVLFWLSWADAGETNQHRSHSFADQFRALPELFGSATFWAYALCMSSGVGVFYVFVTGVPFVNTQTFGLSPMALGIGIGSITGGFFLGSFVSGRIAKRVGVPRMVLWGRIVTLVGMISALVAYGLGTLHMLGFFAAAISAGVGNGLTTPSARAGTMSVRADLAGSASGLGGALIVATGAVLTQVTGAVLTPQNAEWMVLALMAGLALAGYLFALWARHLSRKPEVKTARATGG